MNELTASTAGSIVSVRRASRDDAFRAFYAAEYGDVAGYCFALVGDADLADELAQEAFTAVYTRWSRLREPRAYAFRVAHNTASQHWRRRDRELSSWADLVAAAVPGSAPDPALWDAVRRLPAHLAEVVLLHYLCDLPIGEVARVLRRPTGTVKRRLHEARTLLATTLEDSR